METFYRNWMTENKIRTLSAEEEKEVAKKIQAYKAVDEKIKREHRVATEEEVEIIRAGKLAEEKLVCCNIRLATKFAIHHEQRQSKSDLEVDDYIQEALVGVMSAAKKFDPDKNFKFSTYSSFWINQKMGRATEDMGETIRKPASFHSASRAVHKAYQNAGMGATVEEIAEKTGLKVEEVELVRSQDRVQMISLDQQEYKDDDDSESFHEAIAIDYSLEGEYEEKEQRAAIMDKINMLKSDVDKVIILMHFGFTNGLVALSTEEIAHYLGLDEQYVKNTIDNIIKMWRQDKDSWLKIVEGYC